MGMSGTLDRLAKRQEKCVSGIAEQCHDSEAWICILLSPLVSFLAGLFSGVGEGGTHVIFGTGEGGIVQAGAQKLL